MKKQISLILVLMLMLTCVYAEQENTGKAISLSFSVDVTTGYTWNGFVLGGDCVTLDSDNEIYVSDSNLDMKDGVTGYNCFTLTPVKPGKAIITFTYTKGQEADFADQQILLALVDEGMNLTVSNITETSTWEGKVIFRNPDEHFVLLETGDGETIIAHFDEEMAVPVQDEHVILYTDGIMTLSLPARVNVLAWASVPPAQAR